MLNPHKKVLFNYLDDGDPLHPISAASHKTNNLRQQDTIHSHYMFHGSLGLLNKQNVIRHLKPTTKHKHLKKKALEEAKSRRVKLFTRTVFTKRDVLVKIGFQVISECIFRLSS